MNIPKFAWHFWMLLVGALLSAACQAGEGTANATFDFDKFTQQQAFHLNKLQTTPYGPAWADIVLKPANMVECSGASIALCYYSGAGPTTPCNKDGDLANCTCYAIPQGQKYQVDINAILNLDVYLQTVKTCGKDGHKCAPRGSETAPVCNAINNNTLIPGADLISAFSTYMVKTDDMPISPTACTTAAYAGCMTAPCKKTNQVDPKTHLPLVQCACPTYTGPYQVGQKTDQCTLTGVSVWSAAYTPPRNEHTGSSKKTSTSASTTATDVTASASK